ncbi:hypothetical protein OPV22_023167 [Ensete ventricosum]|uniref:Uncharacterized protein n=1 Tax=Ensete ventricosum TaxID=4639 RepID=A0AAV8QU51_ENSVE|nr:hypothetical protein OPV22_023167 [Ensete ventricosum]
MTGKESTQFLWHQKTCFQGKKAFRSLHNIRCLLLRLTCDIEQWDQLFFRSKTLGAVTATMSSSIFVLSGS